MIDYTVPIRGSAGAGGAIVVILTQFSSIIESSLIDNNNATNGGEPEGHGGDLVGSMIATEGCLLGSWCVNSHTLG